MVSVCKLEFKGNFCCWYEYFFVDVYILVFYVYLVYQFIVFVFILQIEIVGYEFRIRVVCDNGVQMIDNGELVKIFLDLQFVSKIVVICLIYCIIQK